MSYPAVPPGVDPAAYYAWLQSQQPQAAPAPQPTYAPPVPAPMPQPTYAPPAAPAPMPQAATLPVGADSNPFGRPAVAVSGPTPRVKDLNGRLVGFKPTAYEAEAPNALAGPNQSKTQPRITADVYVFDGPELIFGGSPDYDKNPRPHTHRVEAPTMFTGVWDTHQEIVKSCLETTSDGRTVPSPKIILGRIMRGTEGNQPWLIRAIPEVSPDMDLALRIFNDWQRGISQPNKPIPLAPPVPAQSAAYGQPAAPWNPAAQGFVPPQPQAYAPPMPVPMPAPVPQPAMPMGPPPGPWSQVPQQFAALSPTDQAAVWAQHNAQTSGAGNPFAQ